MKYSVMHTGRQVKLPCQISMSNKHCILNLSKLILWLYLIKFCKEQIHITECYITVCVCVCVTFAVAASSHFCNNCQRTGSQLLPSKYRLSWSLVYVAVISTQVSATHFHLHFLYTEHLHPKHKSPLFIYICISCAQGLAPWDHSWCPLKCTRWLLSCFAPHVVDKFDPQFHQYCHSNCRTRCTAWQQPPRDAGPYLLYHYRLQYKASHIPSSASVCIQVASAAVSGYGSFFLSSSSLLHRQLAAELVVEVE